MKSVRATAEYKPLIQDSSDNEDEEDPSRHTELSSLASTHCQDDLKLSELHMKKTWLHPVAGVEVVKKQGIWTGLRTACFVISIFIATSVVVGLIIMFPYLQMVTITQGNQAQTKEWNVSHSDYMTESLVRLVDVDEDGRLDIIFSMVNEKEVGKETLTRENGKEYCKKRGFKEYPCVSRVIALRGYDGALLWEFYAHSSIFEINCGNIDIDRNGKMDCIATGRMSTLVAFDPRKGKPFWSGESGFYRSTWNSYNVLVIQDFNNDGVPELVLVHGGDPDFPPEITTRFSGRLILLDGRTGNHLGERYLDMPDSKESYMSPVLHKRKDGSQYILFGHGGETVPGTLFAISIPDFYRYVYKLDRTAPVANVVGNYYDWGNLPKSDIGLIEIYRGEKKGVMVPPVLQDMNGDGVKDIVLSAYDGQILLYDGETLKQIWTTGRIFNNMESYSSPAPGYYNNDDILDFMLHENYGAWPVYYGSKKVILDGKDGSVLWSLNGTNYVMTSDFILRTKEKNRDVFIFHVVGRNEAEKLSERVKRDFVTTAGDIKQNQFKTEPKHKSKSDINHPDQTTLTSTHHSKYTSKWNNKQATSNTRHADTDLQHSSYPYDETYLDKQVHQTDYGQGSLLDPSISDDSTERLTTIPVRDYDQHEDADYFNNHIPDQLDTVSTENNRKRDKPEEALVHSHPDDDDDGDDDDDEGHHEGNGHQKLTKEMEEEDKSTPSCTISEGNFVTEVFAMDRTISDEPLLIYKYQPVKVTFNYTDKERKALKLDLPHPESTRKDPRIRTKRHMEEHEPDESPDLGWSYVACVMMGLGERSTGAIGDLDGDGTLDLVIVLDQSGIVRDVKSDSYIRMKMDATLVKINLETRIKETQNFVKVKAKQHKTPDNSMEEKKFSELEFMSYDFQPWTAYLGKKANSVYDVARDTDNL